MRLAVHCEECHSSFCNGIWMMDDSEWLCILLTQRLFGWHLFLPQDRLMKMYDISAFHQMVNIIAMRPIILSPKQL